jgi:hypothetical protein
MVLTTSSAAQKAAMLRSRALLSVTLITPSTHAVIRATQSTISAGLGIALRTGGTNVTATIPVKSAIENWSSSGTSTPKERRSRREYWRASLRRPFMDM